MLFRRDLLTLLGFAGLAAAQSEKDAPEPVGFEDTPYLPDQKWHVHDIKRPHPRVVTPGAQPGMPPSDAVVLFDGKDLSRWAMTPPRGQSGLVAPTWRVQNGAMEVAPNSGSLVTRERFGTCQLHVEWASPAKTISNSQGRGNSGVLLMSRYEIQVLDSWNNLTYADGQAGAIYGQWPPLVNATRRPGEWQAYDILFEAPQFDNGKVVKPAYSTVLLNGVMLHHHQPHIGAMRYRQVGVYEPHGPEEPLELQSHRNAVRYRNIWIRRIKGYDQPEA